MKKIFASLLLALTTMGASAQDNPNRLIIQPKQGNPSGYLVERLDSVYFTKINGRVAADIIACRGKAPPSACADRSAA